MKSRQTRKIAKEIYRKFIGEECKLTDYLVEHFNSLESIQEAPDNLDDLLDALAWEQSYEIAAIMECINEEITSHRLSNRIKLDERIDGIFVSLSSIGKDVIVPIEQEYYSYFTRIEKLEKMEKGLIYEEFCRNFLEDLGLEAEKTPPSNDKGIDIIAKYQTNLSEQKSKLVFDDYVYLIGQAKFFSEKVDTPIIRRLVGDSLFIRFNQLEYKQLSHNAIHQIVFSHSGFTKAAIEFCTLNKVMRLETSQMVTILSSTSSPESTKSLTYLRNKFRSKDTI